MTAAPGPNFCLAPLWFFPLTAQTQGAWQHPQQDWQVHLSLSKKCFHTCRFSGFICIFAFKNISRSISLEKSHQIFKKYTGFKNISSSTHPIAYYLPLRGTGPSFEIFALLSRLLSLSLLWNIRILIWLALSCIWSFFKIAPSVFTIMTAHKTSYFSISLYSIRLLIYLSLYSYCLAQCLHCLWSINAEQKEGGRREGERGG